MGKSPTRKGQTPLGSVYLPDQLFARLDRALKSRVHEFPLKKSDLVRTLLERWVSGIEELEEKVERL